MSALTVETMLAKANLSSFKRKAWARSSVHMRGPVSRFGALPKMRELASVENALLNLTHGSATVYYPQTWVEGRLPSLAANAFSPSEALALQQLGCSVHLPHIEQLSAQINQALSSLRVQMGSVAGVSCDVLVGGGLPPWELRFERTNAFIVQLEGTSEWQAGRTRWRLSRGSTLYAWGGVQANALSKGALILMVHVPLVSAGEAVLRALTFELVKHVAFRAPAFVAPTHSGRKQAERTAQALSQQLPRFVKGLDVGALLNRARGRAFRRARGVSATLVKLPGRDGSSVLKVHSTKGAAEVTFDSNLASGCAWVLEQRRFDEAEARVALGLQSEDFQSLLNSLLEAGLLSIAP